MFESLDFSLCGIDGQSTGGLHDHRAGASSLVISGAEQRNRGIRVSSDTSYKVQRH